MSGKLDQSLDDILTSNRKTGARRGHGRRAVTAGTRVSTRAPVGGIQKKTPATKGGAKAAAPNGPAAGTGDTKIIVSNLPSDVSEVQIKEYFGKSVGAVRRAMLTYGPNGVSRGIATIIFAKPGDANKALVQLNGMLVDKRPMRIEVVLDANRPAPAKALSERVAQPNRTAKPKPKPATEKAAPNGERGGRAGRGRGAKRGRNTGRPKAKTADELDAEMMDYFDPNAANGTTAPATENAAPATNGTAAATAVAAGGDDLGMEEIS